MRPVRELTDAEDNFRVSPIKGLPGWDRIQRDFVEPEPIGTIVLKAFRVTGYDKDCDGSAMARLAAVDSAGEDTGWEPTNIGLYANTGLVVTEDELRKLFGAGQ